MAYVVQLPNGRLKAAYKDHVKGVWKRKTVPDGTTKRECERLANELEHNSWLRAEGLAVRRAESPMKLVELVEWWLKERCPAASVKREKVRLMKHVQTHKIAGLRLGQVDSSDIGSLLYELDKDGAAAASINRLRASLHSIFAHAIDARKWTGTNPVAGGRRAPFRSAPTIRSVQTKSRQYSKQPATPGATSARLPSTSGCGRASSSRSGSLT
jgi:hypothetical protein